MACLFLNAAAELGTRSRIVAEEQASTVNGGCYFLWAFGELLLVPEGAGHNGTAHAQSANNDAYKNGFGPSNTAA